MIPGQHRASLALAVVPLLAGALVALLLGFLFREMTHDFMQHDADAAYFFEAASTGDFSFSLDETNENVLPILLYSWIYDTVSQLGISPTPIWGILLNAVLVFASQLLTLMFARKVFGYDEGRLNRLAVLLSVNGLLMMFAGIHMRDAFLLFITTVSMLAFIPRASSALNVRLLQFLLLLLLMSMAYLCRKEGFVVPFMIYVVSLAMAMKRGNATSTKVVVFGFAISLIGLAVVMGVLDLALDNYNNYRRMTQEQANEGSLAYHLIYEQPFPLSAINSATLVLFVKFPFWRECLFDSYAFFVSVGALQMLFVAPAFIALVAHAFVNKVSSEVGYLLLVQLGLLLMVAMTSSQVRHFAVGYPFLLLLFHMRAQILGPSSPYVRLQHGIFAVAVVLNVVAGLR